ncbi:unnamed protein product, partial [Bemisia tabaci]
SSESWPVIAFWCRMDSGRQLPPSPPIPYAFYEFPSLLLVSLLLIVGLLSILKCLRLSENPVVLKLKRDPNIKAKVRSYLSSPESHVDRIVDNGTPCEKKSSVNSSQPAKKVDDKFKNHISPNDSPVPPPSQHPLPVNEVTRSQGIVDLENEPIKNSHQQPRFEAFMMTGDRVLKLTRNQQVSLLPKHSRKIDSLLKHHHNNNNNYSNYHSVPTSPIDMSDKSRNNHHHSKKQNHQEVISSSAGNSPPSSIGTSNTAAPVCSSSDAASSSYVVRTSKSEDHLQLNKNSNSLSTVSIDFDDDVTSSLNTLLDTRPDSEGEADQRVWSYHTTESGTKMKNSSSSVSNNSSDNNASSQNHSLSSPASPTSVSSSVMSSTSSSSSSHERKKTLQAQSNANIGSTNQNISSSLVNNGGDLSQSEAISNISSPDFQEDSEILNSKDFNIEISDPSDSDSTLLVSESTKGGSCRLQRNENAHGDSGDHRIVIQVKGRCSPKVNFRNNSRRGSHKEQDYSSSGEQPSYMTLNEDDEQLLALTKGAATLARAVSPPLPNSQSSNGLSEDESDIESLRSFHYSPKAVDHPSASRLAKRLFTLDGFKKSDVSRHLSKNNDFSRAVADEFLKYFNFEGDTLDVALRKFLKQFSLSGETQERERVLVHFSKRYLDCNPGAFKSQDAVHTLTCALMLLNSDLHGKIIGRKMTCSEFIENLAELNDDGENFPKDVLKASYHAIKNCSLEWAVDDEVEDNGSMKGGVGLTNDNCQIMASDKGFFQSMSSTIEYKKGYVMRKCCVEPNGKRTPLGKRGWKMFYCTLRDFVLYLHKDEHGFRKTQLSDNLHNAIRIHHSLATKATDYRKKQHVFRLQTADQAEYLFQTSDSKELQSWVDTINFVCASFSAPPLPGGCGSQKKFQRPLLPTTYTKLNLREQMLSHEETVMRLELELDKHTSHPPERGAKALTIQNYKEKNSYLHHELKRYSTYAWILRSKLSQYPELDQPSSLTDSCIGEVGEMEEEYCDEPVMNPNSGKNSPSLNRYSYRAAIYSTRESDLE